MEGRVARPLELSLADIIESPTTEARSSVWNAPATPRAVRRRATQSGKASRLLICCARPAPASEAASVLLEGADTGRLMPESPHLPYCQIVPIAKCLRPESMVAFKLNDRFLPRKNGFPARALFPGWYAMDSVKWLQRIIVLGPEDEPRGFQSSGMNKVYNRIRETSRRATAKVTRLSEHPGEIGDCMARQ